MLQKETRDSVVHHHAVHRQIVRPAKSRSVGVGLLMRYLLVAVLSLTLVGAMRWALRITNANTQQVAKGLERIQDRLDADAERAARDEAAGRSNRAAPGQQPDAGPGSSPGDQPARSPQSSLSISPANDAPRR